jgi:hypothetical protein
MTLVHKPNPLPSELSYVPANSTPYKVENRDNWYALADRPEVKSSGLSALDLCYYNFKTKKPMEINWYLYNKVGCRISTNDGKNYMFSNGDQPGIIHLPKPGPPLPVNEIVPVMPEARSNAWFGLVAKAGTHFVVIGIETIVGVAFSLDEPGKAMGISASVNRFGLGFGAGTGVACIYITGVSNPGQLNGFQQMDDTNKPPDFNLSLGENWGKALKVSSKVQKMQPLINVIKTIGAYTPSGLKKALASNPDNWANLVKAGKGVNDSMGIDMGGGPNVFMFDVPFIPSPGAEASFFWGLYNFNAFWEN